MLDEEQMDMFDPDEEVKKMEEEVTKEPEMTRTIILSNIYLGLDEFGNLVYAVQEVKGDPMEARKTIEEFWPSFQHPEVISESMLIMRELFDGLQDKLKDVIK